MTPTHGYHGRLFSDSCSTFLAPSQARHRHYLRVLGLALGKDGVRYPELAFSTSAPTTVQNRSPDPTLAFMHNLPTVFDQSRLIVHWTFDTGPFRIRKRCWPLNLVKYFSVSMLPTSICSLSGSLPRVRERDGVSKHRNITQAYGVV